MEKHPHIPKDMYSRWWKVINEEFGDIIENKAIEEEERITIRDQEPPKSVEPQPVTTNDKQDQQPSKRTEVGDKLYLLSKEEEEDLAVYLDLGMSLNEAREQHKKELEVAEMRMRIRENVRLKNRGSVESKQRERNWKDLLKIFLNFVQQRQYLNVNFYPIK